MTRAARALVEDTAIVTRTHDVKTQNLHGSYSRKRLIELVKDKRAQVTCQKKIPALPTNDTSRAPAEDATARFDRLIQITVTYKGGIATLTSKLVVDKRTQITYQNEIITPTNDSAKQSPAKDAMARFDQMIKVTITYKRVVATLTSNEAPQAPTEDATARSAQISYKEEIVALTNKAA